MSEKPMPPHVCEDLVMTGLDRLENTSAHCTEVEEIWHGLVFWVLIKAAANAMKVNPDLLEKSAPEVMKIIADDVISKTDWTPPPANDGPKQEQTSLSLIVDNTGAKE